MSRSKLSLVRFKLNWDSTIASYTHFDFLWWFDVKMHKVLKMAKRNLKALSLPSLFNHGRSHFDHVCVVKWFTAAFSLSQTQRGLLCTDCSLWGLLENAVKTIRWLFSQFHFCALPCGDTQELLQGKVFPWKLWRIKTGENGFADLDATLNISLPEHVYLQLNERTICCAKLQI